MLKTCIHTNLIPKHPKIINFAIINVNAMVIEKEKVVSLIYELRVDNASGDVIETVDQANPLTFVFGSGRLLPKFEENINGLQVGEDFQFQLTSLEAYGEIDENAIVNVPKNAFVVNGSIDENILKLGNTIPMQDTAGNRLNGIVKDISDENVTMDFNHPLAGKQLFFTGKVADLRQATEEEIAGLNSGCGCSGCGCDSGEKSADSCGSGSCC